MLDLIWKFKNGQVSDIQLFSSLGGMSLMDVPLSIFDMYFSLSRITYFHYGTLQNMYKRKNKECIFIIHLQNRIPE